MLLKAISEAIFTLLGQMFGFTIPLALELRDRAWGSRAMTEGEKTELSTFGVGGRQRVAQDAKCTVAQVDDCVAKYLWMREMLAGVAHAKREGKPVPKSIEDMEQSLGAY